MFHNEIIKMEWLLHCSTGSLRKHKPSVPCSVSLSNNYMIVKAFSRNITGNTNLAFSKNVSLQLPVRLSFQGLSSFLVKEKSAKCTYFATERVILFLILRVILGRWSVKTLILSSLRRYNSDFYVADF